MQLIFDEEAPVNITQKMSLVQASPVGESLPTEAPLLENIIASASEKEESESAPEKHKNDEEEAVENIVTETENVSNGSASDETELTAEETTDKDVQGRDEDAVVKTDNVENKLQENKNNLMDLAVKEDVECGTEVNNLDTNVVEKSDVHKNGECKNSAVDTANEVITSYDFKNQDDAEESGISNLDTSLNEDDLLKENLETSINEDDLLKEDNADGDVDKKEDGCGEVPDKFRNKDIQHNETQVEVEQQKLEEQQNSNSDKNVQNEQQLVESMEHETSDKDNVSPCTTIAGDVSANGETICENTSQLVESMEHETSDKDHFSPCTTTAGNVSANDDTICETTPNVNSFKPQGSTSPGKRNEISVNDDTALDKDITMEEDQKLSLAVNEDSSPLDGLTKNTSVTDHPTLENIHATITTSKETTEPVKEAMDLDTSTNDSVDVPAMKEASQPVTEEMMDSGTNVIDSNDVPEKKETSESVMEKVVELDVPANKEAIEPSMEHVKDLGTSIDDFNTEESLQPENNTKDNANKEVVKSTEIINSATKGIDLANNLEIFSDDEDEAPSTSKQTAAEDKELSTDKVDQNKECVSLVDDDDDIMVIDDDTSSKTDKTEDECTVVKEETKIIAEPAKVSSENKTLLKDDVIPTGATAEEAVQESDKVKSSDSGIDSESKEKTTDRPLVANDFLSNFKSKMKEMTRADLEEFCVLKIVEGVIDRSNLSEIKAKLKTMMQNVEEWRKKSMVLNKQNRDLQIVLRTVQEEQKKRSDEIITPLKITRSVGMQVLMGDGKMENLNRTRNVKRVMGNSAPPPKSIATKPAGRNQKQPIPVPRLVPASPSKPAITKASPQLQNSTVTSNSGSAKAATPNGVKSFTPVKIAEKRPYSDAIDLTEDEPAPPAKKPPVRLVPSQQLLAPGRASFINNTPKNSSPRQVYIPIGSQNNIRAGQTLVFKNGGQNVRTRGPGPGTIVRGSTPATRPNVVRNQNKHPAPLPQAYSQPQPPNWKALPPAPDLKISKIENGIVVSWKIEGYQESSYEEIVSYQLYAYQETSQPASTLLWNKIGDIKALPLPMACTLTQFIAGYKYYFAVRAVDKRSRIGPFSLPGSILLLNK